LTRRCALLWPGGAGDDAQAVASAIGLFGIWTLATYLLEGRPGTFLQPDATSRFVYTLTANVLIGPLGRCW
jgi:hypothetical protein